MELHRAISSAVQALNQHHTVLVGAILGCDTSTQQRVLNEHRSLIESAADAIARLGSFAEQCRVGAPPLPVETAAISDDDPAPVQV